MEAEKDPRLDVEQLTRPEAVDRIRAILRALEDDKHCACVIASRFGVFCKGFDQLSDLEFKQRFFWVACTRPQATREELELLVSQYHFGRRQVSDAAICCDTETREHWACDGWNSFDNKALVAHYQTLTGRLIRVG